MSLDFPGGLVIPYLPDYANAAPDFVNSTLNSGTTKVAFVFMSPVTDTLEWFEWRQTSNAVTPTNGVRFSIQGLTGDDPDGTDQVFADVTSGFGANAWLVPANALTSTGAGGGTKLSLTAGTQYAAVAKLPTYVAGSITMTTNNLANSQVGLTALNYCDVFAASWARNANTASIAFKFTNAGYYPIAPNVFPVKTLTSTAFNSGSTPDEIALAFIPAANCYFSGVVFRADLDAAATVSLYSGTTAIAGPIGFTGRQVTTGGYALFPFPATLLSGGSVYRVAIAPSSGSNITLYSWSANSASLMAAAAGGTGMYYSSRTNAGAWTDDTASRPWAAVLLNGFTTYQPGAEVSYPG